ncbi:MAG: ADP-ribosylglycohydrolase family protein, partial [bacterium]|nr:ADP-ribosylglycohydrolase family protein [bacterium]
AMVASDFREAVRMASNHGGDSDSTASIAGQIRGAWTGLDGIPNAWIRRLDVLEALLDVAGG